MAVVIISGGIGSGKTVVCNMLSEEFGWPVYNADSRVKELYDSHPTLLSDIESLFSVSLRDSEGRFRPDALSAVIFRDKEALLKVEDLVFPVLKEDFASWQSTVSDNEFLVLESATILEKPALVGLGDFVAVVDAPLEMRIERACNRTGASRSSIQAARCRAPRTGGTSRFQEGARL